MAGLWNAEAASCNQMLFWEPGAEIQRAAYQADLLAQGLAAERHSELLAWIAQEQSVLLTARQMVWKSHVRSARETVQHHASPGRWHGEGGGGGKSGDGDEQSAVSPQSIAGSDTSEGSAACGRSVIAAGKTCGPARNHDTAETGQPQAWPDDSSTWEEGGGAGHPDSDPDADGAAAHHAIFTPYLPDEERSPCSTLSS
jgi:hypothetical protein